MFKIRVAFKHMLNAEIARISLRIYHKLNKRGKTVEILGKNT